MSYKGDFLIGATVDFKFTTVDDAGLPATLSGTPAVSAYPNNGTTEITAGVTLTVDFDAKTGLNHVRIVASEANGYARGTDYELVITAGTSGGDSIVGYTVGSFSVENRWPLNKAVGRFVVGTGSTAGTSQPPRPARGSVFSAPPEGRTAGHDYERSWSHRWGGRLRN
jgi:hypothetical protein